jgi:hypothetical protein
VGYPAPPIATLVQVTFSFLFARGTLQQDTPITLRRRHLFFDGGGEKFDGVSSRFFLKNAVL